MDKVRRLLNALGDTDEAHPLSARFRRTATRLKRRLVDKEKANTFAQLTLAFHDLNLLLGDAFYPGDSSQRPNSRSVRSAVVLICAGLLLFVLASRLRADQVEMRNGDRYAGQVLSLGTNTVVLQSDWLGTLRLPRVKVAAIKLGAFPATNSPALPPPTNGQSTAASSISPANGPPDLSPAFRQLGANTNLIQQVQKQFLSGAGPEANAKFNDLLGGYMSGRLSVDDIRAEARAAADQLRALQRESGEDAGFAAGAYLAILDHFLKETTPSTSATNTPGALPKTKPE